MTDKTTDLAEYEPAGKVLERHQGNTLPAMMWTHHPIHGLFGAAFEEIGGFARLKEWGDNNYGQFVSIFARMAPPPQPVVSNEPVVPAVDPSLKRTVLDGEKA